MSVWQELCPPVYPEGDYVAVFCNKCGGKNRQDEGWRYRDDPHQRALMASMGPVLMMMMESLGRRPAQLTYECAYCRDDDKKRSPGDEDRESDEEDEEESGEDADDDKDTDKGAEDDAGRDVEDNLKKEADQEGIVAVPAECKEIKAQPSVDENAVLTTDVDLVSDSDRKRKADVKEPAQRDEKCAKNDNA